MITLLDTDILSIQSGWQHMWKYLCILWRTSHWSPDNVNRLVCLSKWLGSIEWIILNSAKILPCSSSSYFTVCKLFPYSSGTLTWHIFCSCWSQNLSIEYMIIFFFGKTKIIIQAIILRMWRYEKYSPSMSLELTLMVQYGWFLCKVLISLRLFLSFRFTVYTEQNVAAFARYSINITEKKYRMKTINM